MINNETYFEFDEDLNQGFTTIPNYILNDKRLSYKAVGVYVQILQYRNTGKHKVYIKSLSNYRHDRKTAVSSAIKELEMTGYITKNYIRNKRGQIQGLKYVVRMKPIEGNVENTTNSPKSENLTSDNLTSENTTLINKIGLKENVLKENDVVDVVEKTPQEKVIEMYKAFKIEKRVMPQMTNLLKQYSDKMSLEVFEYIFIQASEESVTKKYNYIKTLLEKFYEEKVTNMTQLKEYNENYKSSKDKKNKNFKKNVSTKHHQINQTFKKYSEIELEEVLIESQQSKLKTNTNTENCQEESETCRMDEVYRMAIEQGIEVLEKHTKKHLIDYAINNKLFIPASWGNDKK